MIHILFSVKRIKVQGPFNIISTCISLASSSPQMLISSAHHCSAATLLGSSSLSSTHPLPLIAHHYSSLAPPALHWPFNAPLDPSWLTPRLLLHNICSPLLSFYGPFSFIFALYWLTPCFVLHNLFMVTSPYLCSSSIFTALHYSPPALCLPLPGSLWLLIAPLCSPLFFTAHLLLFIA